MSATVLVVDDSPTMRRLVRRALEQSSLSVLEAQDGKDALEVLGGASADFVITDVNMPEMDGLTLVRELRRKPDFRFTPILVLTTEQSDGMKQRGRDAGATGWLVKPFDPTRLSQLVTDLLRRRGA